MTKAASKAKTASKAKAAQQHHAPWTPECTRQLLDHYLDGLSLEDIAKKMARSPKAIEAKVASLRKSGDLIAAANGSLRTQQEAEPCRSAAAVAAAESKFLDQLLALGGMPEARVCNLRGTPVTVWFGPDQKPHPLWLAKSARPEIARAA